MSSYKKLMFPPLLGIVLFSSCISPGCMSNTGRTTGGNITLANNTTDTDKLLIVDCLLPGTIRQLGTRLTTLTARRAVKTSGADCERRGGEYVAADKANYESALKVWKPLAEAGDVQAQTYVGEIYEKGMGTSPNYQQAKFWYIQAAGKGDARAKTNLGFMNEQGLGSGGSSQANKLYGDASGLGAAYSATDQLPAAAPKPPPSRERLKAEQVLKQAHVELKQKKQKVAELKQQAAATKPPEGKKQEEEVRQQEQRVKDAEKKLETVKKSESAENASSSASAMEKASVKGLNFGKYYAVVIGNSDYKSQPNLSTSVNDAKAVASLLKGRYGFRAVVLSNATRGKMLASLDSLRNRLTSKDNLLIYYAGHSKNVGGSCYWLPVDAEAGNRKSWVSNAQVANFVDAMKAKHILIVADSCYTGVLSQRAIPRVPASGEKSRQWYVTVAKTKVRVVLSSGVSKPMQSTSDGKHSVFARAFLDALGASGSVVEGARVYRQVKTAAKPPPKFAPIQFAGHESGDFVFLKGGKVALGDEEQPGNGPQHRNRKVLAVLGKSFLLLEQAARV